MQCAPSMCTYIHTRKRRFGLCNNPFFCQGSHEHHLFPILKMTTYMHWRGHNGEVKERSGGGGHWRDKSSKVEKLKYRSFLSLSGVFIFNESTDSFYINFSSHCCLHSSIIISLSCVFFFNESTDSCFVIAKLRSILLVIGTYIGFKITLKVYCKTLEVFYNTLNCVLQYIP